MYRDVDSIGFGRTPLLWLVFLAFLAVLLATLPVGRLLGGEPSGTATLALYTAAVTAALVAIHRASRSGEDGWFWSFVGCAVLLRFVGNVGWISIGFPVLPSASLVVHDAAYALSYVAMTAALFVLVTGAVSGLLRITAVVVLDACCIALSVGLLVWYFALGGTMEGVLSGGQATFMFALKPAADAALLSVALLLYAEPRRPVFVPYLAAALACLLFADAIHLTFPNPAPVNLGGWPEALRAVGFIILCLGALRSVGQKEMREPGADVEVGRGALSFWFGPLSPALHCAILLVWGALHTNLPPGVLAGAGIVMVYLALRSGILARANRRLRRQRERLAADAERARISVELHDSLKQELNIIPLMLEMYRATNDPETAERYLLKAVSISRTASERVDFSVAALQTFDQNATAPEVIRMHIENLGRMVAYEIEEALDDSLDDLTPEETLVARQVVNEALWNSARHSGATRVRVESGRSGTSGRKPVLSISDDGCGFDAGVTREGTGSGLMRRRAETVGAALEITSTPGNGTEVRLEFPKR